MTATRATVHQRIDDLPLHRRAWLTWKLYRDPRVSPLLKRAISIGAIAYVLSPVDVIPDILLGAGQLDDIGLLAGLVLVLSRLLVAAAPEAVLASYLGVDPEDVRPDRRRHERPGDDAFDVGYRVK
jgi:uncharacterized membrane protein YkvA (DUF1232 family)